MEVVNVPLTQITVSELNTRKDLQAGTEDVSLSDLADSIRQEGLMHPVTVRHLGAEQFDLIAGQRRFLACQQIGWTTIPAVIRDDLDATQAVVLSLLENVQRADMNPMDKARAFQRMHDDMGSYEEVARRTRVSASTVSKYIALLNLAPSIQERVSTSEGVAGVGTLSVLARFPQEDQEKALDLIAGLNQSIQTRILRDSGGKLGELPGLKDDALEYDLDVRMCREGLCFSLPSPIKTAVRNVIGPGEENITLAEFKRRIGQTKILP